MTPYRRGARSVESKGIFPGASVVRGHDWSWGQQDGQFSSLSHSALLTLTREPSGAEVALAQTMCKGEM